MLRLYEQVYCQDVRKLNKRNSSSMMADPLMLLEIRVRESK